MSGSSIYRGGGNSSVGSFSKFDSKLAPGHDRARQRTHEATWVKLAEAVPKNEEDWRLARQKHAFSTPAEMVKTLEDLLDGKKKSQLYKTVYLASRYVILRSDPSQKETVYSDLRKCLDNLTLQDDMLYRYMDSVVKLVKALDDLFLKGLLHRAFELVLYIRLNIASSRVQFKAETYFLAFCYGPLRSLEYPKVCYRPHQNWRQNFVGITPCHRMFRRTLICIATNGQTTKIV
ncbi:hypothetical protein FMUND_2103 [Fusarium mundagurra]|uniref:Uncharacterized protein n=1 Tax=Fusarium mundagurra TaxID=1567541 RepID=A0A8H5Z3B7_9HYPO|nr:hypothetical protein FMUND_2103 [Fusarium mundagurra]